MQATACHVTNTCGGMELQLHSVLMPVLGGDWQVASRLNRLSVRTGQIASWLGCTGSFDAVEKREISGLFFNRTPCRPPRRKLIPVLPLITLYVYFEVYLIQSVYRKLNKITTLVTSCLVQNYTKSKKQVSCRHDTCCWFGVFLNVELAYNISPLILIMFRYGLSKDVAISASVTKLIFFFVLCCVYMFGLL